MPNRCLLIDESGAVSWTSALLIVLLVLGLFAAGVAFAGGINELLAAISGLYQSASGPTSSSQSSPSSAMESSSTGPTETSSPYTVVSPQDHLVEAELNEILLASAGQSPHEMSDVMRLSDAPYHAAEWRGQQRSDAGGDSGKVDSDPSTSNAWTISSAWTAVRDGYRGTVAGLGDAYMAIGLPAAFSVECYANLSGCLGGAADQVEYVVTRPTEAATRVVKGVAKGIAETLDACLGSDPFTCARNTTAPMVEAVVPSTAVTLARSMSLGPRSTPPRALPSRPSASNEPSEGGSTREGESALPAWAPDPRTRARLEDMVRLTEINLEPEDVMLLLPREVVTFWQRPLRALSDGEDLLFSSVTTRPPTNAFKEGLAAEQHAEVVAGSPRYVRLTRKLDWAAETVARAPLDTPGGEDASSPTLYVYAIRGAGAERFGTAVDPVNAPYAMRSVFPEHVIAGFPIHPESRLMGGAALNPRYRPPAYRSEEGRREAASFVPLSIVQPVDSLEQLYARAKAEWSSFVRDTQVAALASGGQPVLRGLLPVSEALEHLERLDGDATKLTGVLRSRIEVSSIDDAYAGLHYLLRKHTVAQIDEHPSEIRVYLRRWSRNEAALTGEMIFSVRDSRE